MSPIVSVIVPSYQGEKRLPVLLGALAKQVTELNFEVVLVIDGSTDRSLEVARSLKNSLELRVLDRNQNLGRSMSLNEGFEAARGEVLIRCDDDLEPAPDYVDRFAQAISEDPVSGVVGLYRNVYPETPYAKVYGRPVDVRFRSEAYCSPPDSHWRYWAGNCAVHRSTWNRVGPYDGATYRAYGWEDIDWGYRLAQAGSPVRLLKELETPHHVAATTATIRADRARASGAAAAAFDAKHSTQSLPVASGPWGLAVRSASSPRLARSPQLVDRILSHLPSSSAMKLMDLVIQSEFRRGYIAAQPKLARKGHQGSS